MNKMLRPAGLVLVGAIFIYQCIMLAASGAEPTNLPDLQSKLKESISMSHASGLQFHGSEFMQQGLSSKEKISLEGSHSLAVVSDLKATNTVKERDIVCNEAQNGDPNAMGLVNSLDVTVTGQQGELNKAWPEESQGDKVEVIVDNALNASQQSSENYGLSRGQKADGFPQIERLGNDLDIDVHGISVSAVNTVKGGSAVATSNIVIKPVQIIICPSEVEEKLK
ncbi:MAG: hypothetical protein LUO89_07000 [Methanothrix sp.]|nr:hypothetical protein [Methanothrix sp.]